MMVVILIIRTLWWIHVYNNDEHNHSNMIKTMIWWSWSWYTYQRYHNNNVMYTSIQQMMIIIIITWWYLSIKVILDNNKIKDKVHQQEEHHAVFGSIGPQILVGRHVIGLPYSLLLFHVLSSFESKKSLTKRWNL